ncbi:I78 family peptidase inhibitor [Pseudorhodobacter ferrugineus]|uniref:I78 family peptidase inhibitor n=1 Tax=Pseudorhodobacter ferrugineus TaxID=77008 RepID=UPI0003B4B2C9|nr:I78 family peptidase inhibitor [Pseudorhodobacter ferrugineus]
MKYLLPLVALSLCLGCVRAPDPEPVYVPPPVFDNGLVTREPDSCGVDKLTGLMGQPEGMLRTVQLPAEYRIVPFGTLVTQEYNSHRVDIYLDEKGLIARITCG